MKKTNDKPTSKAAAPKKAAAKPAAKAVSKKPAAKAATKPAAKAATKPAAKASASKPATKPPAKASPAKAATKPAAKEASTKAEAPVAPKPAAGKQGTRAQPWTLTTPSGGSEFQAFRDEALEPPALVVVVGKTELRYDLRCLDDLHSMLRAHGDWMPLGGADEQKPAAEGSVEAWARSPKNPIGGFYGLKKGLRGRFAHYVPPVMKLLGRAEVEEKARDNRMRAI